MSNARFVIVLLLLAGLIVFASLPGSSEHPGRITIRYWEKWDGFEAVTMGEMVDEFNKSQDKIYVDYSSISQLDHKLMMSISGGDPPDVAGVWSHAVPVMVEDNAILPLDQYASESGIKREQYIDVYWQLCNYRDHLWCLPTTAASIALVYNKKMFRDAGLDPEKPPRSIQELEADNEKILKRAPDGSITQIGHLPQVPGWYVAYLGCWFGGKLWDGQDKLTANSPENIAAYQWIESYPKRFGADKLRSLRDGFGNFGSPQDPFISGRVAMVMQGPWIADYINNYAPKDAKGGPIFDWGVAPFPSADPDKMPNAALVECDGLVIPKGAKHPREAFEFIHFINTQKYMEELCVKHHSFSPLANYSPDFYERNPNPQLRVFADLAKSPNAFFAPRVTNWTQYHDDMQNAVEQISSGDISAEAALDEVQVREQASYDRRVQRWQRREPELLGEWRRTQP